MADLITVQEYKNAEGIVNSKEDSRLDIIVPQVSNLAKKYCGTSFVDYYSSDKTETFSVSDNFTSTIIVSESPLVSVTSVKERSTYDSSYDTLTTTDYEYYVDTAADAIVRTTKSGAKKAFPQGLGSVQIAYRAGFSAAPSDLKLALFDLVTYYLKDEHKERRTIAGATLQNQGTSGVRDNTDFPDHIKRVLDLYRVII
tara:strand:- start:3588 stop:4184 length:597 start_codon:yes stop_codon:yes gene_type:complete